MALVPPQADEAIFELENRRLDILSSSRKSPPCAIDEDGGEQSLPEFDEDDYPEGGMQAWIVVLGAWCSMMLSMGVLNTVAVLQAWVLEHQLKDYSEFSIGWIFSVYSFFLCVGGAQVGPVFDAHDVRWIIVPGTIGFLIAIMCLSVCQEYYQFFLAFGVLGGISASSLFNPALAAIGHWFNKRRGFATGIACTAGGTGGIFFPLIILYLAPKIGFPWAIRIIGFICAALGAVACCCLRKRLPHNKKAGASIDLKALINDRDYAMMTAAIFLVEFSVFIPYAYISSYAIHAGVDHQHAYLLNALLNAGAIPGRALPGYVADRFGHINVMCMTSFTCATFIFALWLTAGTNEAAITAFTVIFGFWSGAAISLTPVCVGAVCRTEDIGKRIGTTFTISSTGALIGIPIAGAIVEANGGSYTGLIIFAGATYLAACLAFVVTRVVARGWSLSVIF